MRAPDGDGVPPAMKPYEAVNYFFDQAADLAELFARPMNRQDRLSDAIVPIRRRAV